MRLADSPEWWIRLNHRGARETDWSATLDGSGFCRLYAQSESAVWLDSSDGLGPDSGQHPRASLARNRLTITADNDGRFGRAVRHENGTGSGSLGSQRRSSFRTTTIAASH